ncbi:MAG TPA: trypsin-like peptidase domain-containing protein [Thermoleophilia bacterium]|nr:trypsin-like peptidase domain-containing protein [Thermoleophilia bacterium]
MDRPTAPIPPVGGQPESGRRRPRALGTLITGLILAVAAIALVVGVLSDAHGVASKVGRLGVTFHISQAGALPRPASAAAIQTRVDPGLVNITVSNAGTGFRGEATGMVLTSSGVVLTNNHVVQGATSIKAVDVGNGQTYAGSVVGYDRGGDVAVVQLSGASGLRTVPIGDSSTVAPGGHVTALGNAGGGGGAPRVAAGSVTALGQSIVASDLGGENAERLDGLIQTDAAVLPGDSGGPLVNDAGQVVGMDAAASSANGTEALRGRSPQSYAIPIDDALAVARAIETGPVTAGVHVGPTAFLGVAVVPSPLLVGPGAPQPTGVTIGQALPGYPAARAGLTRGDVITSVDGRAVTTPTDLTDLLIAHHPGDTVRIAWTDAAGNRHVATVRLASGPPA